MDSREVFVVEWLHPDGTWHIDRDLFLPRFTWEEAESSLGFRGKYEIKIERRVTKYVPVEDIL
jgi:hypothetical protein